MGACDDARNTSALVQRWQKIQPAVNKFHSFYEQFERHPKSGTTPDDMKREAIRMYTDFTGQPFKFEHCWEILKNHPKWCTGELTKQCGSKKQKTVDEDTSPPTSTTPTSTTPGSFDTIDLDSPVNEDTNSNGVVRPQGRKAAKEKRRRMNDDKGVIDVLNNLHCTIERQIDFNREELELKRETLKMEKEFREKNQRMKERKNQERIMNTDLNKLQPALRVAYENMQAQIMKEWERDGLFGDVFDSDNADL
ncbi:hypothetical protein LWI29_036552 [Acer saccharum]|uniref:No apical meristem-associated C-terminal domain-containing protein n=1 Tax=Acer saccharum TaxID=4024 RepID=A0AA39VES1_ACESA|nr:hypothetical protein LWI29_036552 [Acer saccharum]